MLNAVRNRIRFFFERFFLRGARNHLLFVASVIIVISLAAGTAHHILYPEISFQDSLWWAFLRLTDPGYLGDDTGLARRIISTILTILGYVVFLGAMVAILTQWLNRTIRHLELGLTPISQRGGHVLITAWTNRTPIIVRELLLSEERVSSFLKRFKRSKIHVVILSKEVSPVLFNDLKEELKELWDPKEVTFRKGTPLRVEDLERGGFLDAGVIIIPGSSVNFVHSGRGDSAVIKTLMTISHYAAEKGRPSPYCVTEITDGKKIPSTAAFYRGELEIIAGNLIISRLIAQTVRHRGLSEVLSELLKNEGNELYIHKSPFDEGVVFKDIRKSFSEAIAIGILRTDGKEYFPLFNPPPDEVVREEDHIILLAGDFHTAAMVSSSESKDLDFTNKSQIEKKRMNYQILIVGWNSKVPSLLRELSEWNEKVDVTLLSVFPIQERAALIGLELPEGTGFPVHHVEGDATSVPAVERLLSEKEFDTVVMLANDWLETDEESDARTITSYVILRERILEKKRECHFIVELLDPDNSVLFDKRDCDLLISSNIISYTLSQVALKRKLRVIYDILFSSRGAEIRFAGPQEYGIVPGSVTFGEIEDFVYSKGEIMIGIRGHCTEKGHYGIVLNPPRASHWDLNEETGIIVISGQ